MKLQKIFAITAFVITFAGWNIMTADDTSFPDFSQKRIFAGVVTPLITQNMTYGFNDNHRGFVDYTARPGSFFHGPVYDQKGNIIEPGDLLIHLKSEYHNALVTQWEATVEAQKALVGNYKQIFERDAKMIKTHAVSEMQYYTDKYNYLNAVATLKSNMASLQQYRDLLAVCTYRARFDGYVNKVMLSAGYCAGEPEVIQISQIVPIGIVLKIDRTLAAQITLNTPMTVYPIQPGGKPAGVIHGAAVFNDNGTMTISCDNPPLLPPVAFDENGKPLPLIMHWSVVSKCRTGMIIDNNELAVLLNIIGKDNSGHYVLRLKDNQNMQPGKGMNFVSVIEKIPVTLGNDVADVAVNYKIINITNSALKEGDVLINPNLPKGVGPGSKICLVVPRYTFMPGDPVKVEIGPTPSVMK